MKTLLINKEAFINWYFDEDVKKTFFDDHNIFLNLLANGVFTIKVNDLLKQAGYLPEEVAEEGQDLILNDDGEIDKSAYDGLNASLSKIYKMLITQDMRMLKLTILTMLITTSVNFVI